jgi:hypothetical protein
MRQDKSAEGKFWQSTFSVIGIAAPPVHLSRSSRAWAAKSGPRSRSPCDAGEGSAAIPVTLKLL